MAPSSLVYEDTQGDKFLLRLSRGPNDAIAFQRLYLWFPASNRSKTSKFNCKEIKKILKHTGSSGNDIPAVTFLLDSIPARAAAFASGDSGLLRADANSS